MVLPPPHLAQEPVVGIVCSMMGDTIVHKEGLHGCALAPGQSARLAGSRGVFLDAVGEIGNDGDSKRSAVSVPWGSAHDPLTH